MPNARVIESAPTAPTNASRAAEATSATFADGDGAAPESSPEQIRMRTLPIIEQLVAEAEPEPTSD